jgi:hypothetical protein
VGLAVIVNEGNHGFERRSSSAIAKYGDVPPDVELGGRRSRE